MTATMIFYNEVAASKKHAQNDTHDNEPAYQSTTCGNTKVTVNGQDVCVIIDFLSDKPLDMGSFGMIPAVRDAIIPHDDNGEIAKFVRDPGRRPLEIVQNLRDSIVPKSDYGEGAKILRDPIKCTVGHLWGGCNQ